ncbi:MAG: hypothetical protein ACFFG0_15320 [Candidatus Thorarchaeota archaeon]
MSKYAVAVTESIGKSIFFDNRIETIIVEAENETSAVIKAVKKFIHPESDGILKDEVDWLDSLQTKLIEEIQQELFDADMNASFPVKI